MIQRISKRIALAAVLTGVSIVSADTASACCLTDWLFGRNTYAVGFAPVQGAFPVTTTTLGGSGFAPVGSPTFSGPTFSAGFAPASPNLITPTQAGFQSPYTAGFAPNFGFQQTANPEATTLALRTPQNFNAFRPFLPAASNLPANAFQPANNFQPANSVAQTSYSVARPAFVDNPSVYTGRPVVNAFTSNLRGVSPASSIGATNTYPTNGGISPVFSSGFRGDNTVVGQPLQGGLINGSVPAARPAPIRNGLARFFGSLFGRGYQPTTYSAPVTYYRPVISQSPVVGQSFSGQSFSGQNQISQVGCVGCENLSTLTPVQQFAPTLGQTQSSISTTPAFGFQGSEALAPASPFATLSRPGSDSTAFPGVSQSGFEAPLSRGIGGGVIPQTPPGGDLNPVDQPRLEARREVLPPAPETPPSSLNRFEPFPERSERPTLDDDQPTDRDEPEDDFWGLQDAADSTAMIRPRRSNRGSSLVQARQSVEPIRGIEPESDAALRDQQDDRDRAATQWGVRQPASQSIRPSDSVRSRRPVAPPLPARSSSLRRGESPVQAYEISTRSPASDVAAFSNAVELPRALPSLSRQNSFEPVQTQRRQPSVQPVARDATWQPVR